MTRDHADLLGAVVTLVIYAACILVFCFRLWGRADWGQWMGGVWLLTAIPLGYLLATASGHARPPLYVVQVSLMLVVLVVVLLLD